jgi:phage terminase large subunit GpA-like protein
MMDVVNDSKYEYIVYMTSTQIGKTTCIENIIGYFVDQDPSPILVIQPSEKPMAETFSEDRLAPMIRDTECLRKKIHSPKGRFSGNKKLHKKFLGGHITLGGANSPAFLASRPIRILIAEEVDRWPTSAGTEGDPLALAIKRTKNFWNRKIIINSTPTIEGASRIEYWYNLSDKRIYMVPCPMCKEGQELIWDNIKWNKSKTGFHLPETAYYECKCCGGKIEETFKPKMLSLGQWKKTAKSKIAGFNISEFYSPWVIWPEMIEDFLKAKKDPEKLKVVVNTSWAKTFKVIGEAPDWKRLHARREKYEKGTIPKKGLILTAGIDVQGGGGSRIECEVVAWGRDKESWSIDYLVIPGEFTKAEIKRKASDLFSINYKHELGFNLNIRLIAIDSGHMTSDVYLWGRHEGENRVMVIRGRDQLNTILSKPTPIDIKHSGRKIHRGVRLWNIGINVIKSELYSYLRKEPDDDGSYPAGYCHFPDYDEEFFKQLTAEHSVRKKTKTGFYRYFFEKIYTRNEVLDCRVYARAAAESLGISRFSDKHWTYIEKSLNTNSKTLPPRKKRGKISPGIKI